MAKQKTERIVVVHVSDKHSGHKLALLNPETKLYTQTPRNGLKKIEINFTEVNEYFWNLWTDKCIPEVIKYAAGDDIFILETGDVSAGNKYTEELISPLAPHQMEIARDAMKPLLGYKNVKVVRYASGTGSHVFSVGSAEIMISEYLKPYYPKIDIGVVFHGLATIRNTGVKIDYAHHGPYGGSRNWLRGNVARYYLQSLMQDELDAGNIPPQLVLRGHYHTPVEEEYTKRCNGHKYRSRIVIAPSMCILDDYARQKTQSTFRITNGIFCFGITKNKVDTPFEISETLDLRTKEELL